MTTRTFFQSISNFLFSRANREFLIFLFFFAIAGVFWLLTTLNETTEQEVKITVRYVNVPKNAVITSPEVDTLRVTVADKGINLLSFLYGGQRHQVSVDFQRYAHSAGSGSVGQSDLLRLVAKELPASSKVNSIKPEKFVFYYNYGERKQVPVRMRGQVVPEKLYFISDTIVEPDSVTIYASRQKLDSISVVYTEQLNFTDWHDTLIVKPYLQKLTGVKVIPEQVCFTFITDVLTEESIEGIPVVGINMPEGKVLRTFPAKVRVRFVTGMKRYQQLSPADFLVVADYNEFSKSQSPKCNIYLRRSPSNISRAKLEVQQVDYLIEERPTP